MLHSLFWQIHISEITKTGRSERLLFYLVFTLSSFPKSCCWTNNKILLRSAAAVINPNNCNRCLSNNTYRTLRQQWASTKTHRDSLLYYSAGLNRFLTVQETNFEFIYILFYSFLNIFFFMFGALKHRNLNHLIYFKW